MIRPEFQLLRLGFAAIAIAVGPTFALAQADVSAIPPGQEALIGEMVGQGATLSGECTWLGTSIERVTIESRYACATGEVSILAELKDGSHSVRGRSARFVFSVTGGAPPSGLVEAVAARFAARERRLRLVPVTAGHARGSNSAPRSDWADGGARLRFRVAIAAVILVTIALVTAAAIIRRSRRLKPAGPTGQSGPWRVQALATAAALGSVVAAHRALWALAAGAEAALMEQGLAATSTGAALALAWAVVASIAAGFVTWLRPRFSTGATLAAVASLYAVTGYTVSRLEAAAEPHRFGSLATLPPHDTLVDRHPSRPLVTYRINGSGFRVPEWAIEKPPGVHRIVLIGDSYVFGIGVGDADTLALRLDETLRQRHPGRQFEVMNLGIPGHNITSHVDLYQEATARLAPDVAVICLTLPNDLSRWDFQTQRREERRLGAFSIANFLVGPRANTFFLNLLLERRVTPGGMAHFDAELARLDRIRVASTGRPHTWLFAYGASHDELRKSFEAHPEMPLIPGAELLPDDYIVGDGHPTASSNRRFASWIANRIDGPRGAASR